MRFHQQYCQPTAQWQRLQAACRAHQALAFVLGNGEYLGHFVITTLTGRTLLAHADGFAQCLEVDISLREFTGDLRQPLKPPAIATTLNRKAAGLTPAIGSGTPLSRAVGLARQAQSALATASQAIRVARQMKTDPVAALTRVPGVINSLGEVATPLIQAHPLLAGLETHFPAASHLTRAAGKVATTASQAKNTLSTLTPISGQALPGALDTVAGQVGGAGQYLERRLPGAEPSDEPSGDTSLKENRTMSASQHEQEHQPGVWQHITREGERWDTLAAHYYGDALGYVRIIAANPAIPITPVLPAGITLAIPLINAQDTVEETPPWLR